MQEICRKNPPCGIGSGSHRSCVMGREPLNEAFFGFRASRLGQRLQFLDMSPLCTALSHDYRNNSSLIVTNIDGAGIFRAKHATENERGIMSKVAFQLALFQKYSDYLRAKIREYAESKNPLEPVFPEKEVMGLLFTNNSRAIRLERNSDLFRTAISSEGAIDFHLLMSLVLAENRLILESTVFESVCTRIEMIFRPFLGYDG